ncbi:3-carboxy-cis,cis-muconate cycloisomerase [soil metagenome]
MTDPLGGPFVVGGFESGILDPLSSGSAAGDCVGDDAVVAALAEVELMLSRSWADSELAPSWVADLTLEGELDLDLLAEGSRSGGNPVIPLVTQLRKHAEAEHPGAGDWVHRGATSQDILDTALMLVAKHAVSGMRSELAALASALATLADTHRATPQAGRTLTQHAAPITFGAKVASWLDGVEAARTALDGIVLPVQLAGSVGIGSAVLDLTGATDAADRLRSALAARLSLADPERSWQAERTPVVALGSALALSIGALGRIAADVLVLARTEVGEVEEGGGAGSSSAMPQKRNPATATLIRSAALQSPGLVATLFASLVTGDERPSGTWHAEWQPLRQLLRLGIETAEATRSLIDSLEVDVERMAANVQLSGGLIYAEHVQSVLTSQVGRAEASVTVTNAIADGGLASLDVELSPASAILAAGIVIDASLARHRLSQETQ